jgi:hypothetical protein
MDRMSSLAGINESTEESDIDAAADDEMEEDKQLSDDEEEVADDIIDESLLPDLSLDEDAEAVTENDHRDFGDDHHVVDSKEHGPFRTEREAVHDAMRVTNGTEFEHFAVIPGKDGYYWRRNLEEELDNEPDPSMVDMAGIENSRHPFQRTPGTALGDNGLRESDDGEYSPEGTPEDEKEQEEFFEEEEEDVDAILESINARYNSFLKGL